MKKSHISHLIAFCIGALLSYIVSDFVHSGKGDSKTSYKAPKIRAKARKPKQNNLDLMMDSMANILQKQVGDMGQALGDGLNIREEVTPRSYKVIIKGEGIDKDSLKINVENGLFEVSGEVKRVIKTDQGSSSYRSRFSRVFSLPRDVVSSNPQMKSDKDEIIITFEKRSI